MKAEKKKLLVLAKGAPRELQLLEKLSDVAEFTVAATRDEIGSTCDEAEVILYWNAGSALFAEIFPHCQNLKWVHSKNAGVESLLTPELVASPVLLTNARGVYARSLAEFAVAGMMYFAKDFPRMLANKEQRVWEQFEVEELAGKTVGIYGYGEIGRKVAERAKAFEMRVLALRRNPQKSADDPLPDAVLSDDERDRLFKESDYLVLAAPSTPETTGAIGAAELELLRPNAVVINIGRGTLIDEPKLIESLKSRAIRGAALDVFQEEPLPDSSELWSLPNVFISPHTADQTATWLVESMDLFLENFRRYLEGKELLNICEKDSGY